MSTRRVVVTASARGSGGAKGAATDSSLSTRFSKLKPTPQRALAIARDERRSVRATTSSNNRAAAIEARRQTGAPVTRGTKRGGARGGSRGGSRGGARGGSGARGGRGAGNTKKKASVHDLDKELDAYRSKDPKFLQAELDREIEGRHRRQGLVGRRRRRRLDLCQRRVSAFVNAKHERRAPPCT